MNIGYLGMNSLKFQLENNDKFQNCFWRIWRRMSQRNCFSLGGKDSHTEGQRCKKSLKNLLHHIARIDSLMLNHSVGLLT